MISETATVAEAAVAEATTVAEAATIAEAIPETAITERRVEEATIPETTTTVAEASDAREVDELSVGRTGRSNNVSRFQIRGSGLDVDIGGADALHSRFGHIGQRGAGEGHDTRRGHCAADKGPQQVTARQFFVHGSTVFRSPPFPLKGGA